MFAVDKYLTPFLTPLGAALVLLALTLFLLASGRRHSAFALLLVSTLALYLASTPFVAAALSGLLERDFPPVAVADSPSADAIILLGGASEPALPPRQAPHLNRHADRIVHAAELFKAGKAKWIIASGGSWQFPSANRPEAADMRDLLLSLGVPASAILLEPDSRDTGANASLSAAVMTTNHLATALLVTSGIHMPRAMASFRRAGVAVTASTADVYAIASPDWPVTNWLPSPLALVETSEAVHELAGMLYYRLRGWA